MLQKRSIQVNIDFSSLNHVFNFLKLFFKYITKIGLIIILKKLIPTIIVSNFNEK